MLQLNVFFFWLFFFSDFSFFLAFGKNTKTTLISRKPTEECDLRVMWEAGELWSASKASESISMLMHEALPAGELSQVRRERRRRGGESRRAKNRGRDEQQQQAFLLLHKIFIEFPFFFFLLHSASSASRTSTWTTRTLKLTRTKREQMRQWMCHRRKRRKKKKTKCHNTFHSRVFVGPFVSLYLLQDLRFQR